MWFSSVFHHAENWTLQTLFTLAVERFDVKMRLESVGLLLVVCVAVFVGSPIDTSGGESDSGAFNETSDKVEQDHVPNPTVEEHVPTSDEDDLDSQYTDVDIDDESIGQFVSETSFRFSRLKSLKHHFFKASVLLAFAEV